MKLALCLFKYYPFGGLEQSFLNIAKEALRQGHEVHVFTRHWTGECPDGIKLHLIKSRGLTNHARCWNFARELKARLVNETFDLVVGFNRMPGLDLYYCADVCFERQASRKHSGLYKLTLRYRLFSRMERAVFAQESKTHIMFISRQAKEEYQEVYGTPEARFHELPPGLNKERIRSALNEETRTQVRQELAVSEQDRLLVMVGSDFKRKGVDRAIRAVAALPAELQRHVKLAVIGKGKPEPLQKLAQDLQVSDRVLFLGPQQNVPRYLAAADMLLHLALSETAGNAIVEGLVAGLPVLVTRTCGFYYHVEDAGAGWVIGKPNFDQQSFNSMLAEALSNSERLNNWSKRALAYSDEVDLYSRPRRAIGIMSELAGN